MSARYTAWRIHMLGSQYRPAPSATESGASPPGKTYSPGSGSSMPVQRSQSATGAVISIDRGSARRIVAPSRACTRIQGSNGRPSPRLHRAYASIGMSGYRSFMLGRTGATSGPRPAARVAAAIAWMISRLRPSPCRSISTSAASADTAVGAESSDTARRPTASIPVGRSASEPSHRNGMARPRPTMRSTASSYKSSWNRAYRGTSCPKYSPLRLPCRLYSGQIPLNSGAARCHRSGCSSAVKMLSDDPAGSVTPSMPIMLSRRSAGPGRSVPAQPVKCGTDGQFPATVDRCFRRAEPARVLLCRESLRQRYQDVRDVGVVAAQDASGGAAPYPADDEFPHGTAGPQLGGPGVEVGEGAREHHVRQHRVGPDELAEDLDHADQIAARVTGFRQPAQLPPEQPEALEEHLADQACLVAEQLVDRRGRSPGLLGHVPGGEPGDAVGGQRGERDMQDVLPQFGRSLLRSGHGRHPAQSDGRIARSSASSAAWILASASSLTRNLVAVCAPRSSLASSAAVPLAASASSAAGTTRSRKPAATASPGLNTSARMAALVKYAGVSRCRQISTATCGRAMPRATSFSMIL